MSKELLADYAPPAGTASTPVNFALHADISMSCNNTGNLEFAITLKKAQQLQETIHGGTYFYA